MLIGVPLAVVSNCADEPSAWVLGDCLTVTEEYDVVSVPPEMVEVVLGLDWPRLEAALAIPPIGETPLSLVPTTMEGGSIWEGWSTRDGRGAGGATACTTA